MPGEQPPRGRKGHRRLARHEPPCSPRVLFCPPPALPGAGREGPDPPGTQGSERLPPCSRPRERTLCPGEVRGAKGPRPPQPCAHRRRQAMRASAGQREARACPCFGLQGELCERDGLHLPLLAVIQARVKPSPELQSALLFALTRPACRGAGCSSAPAASCVCKGSRQRPAGMFPETPHGYICTFFIKRKKK